jgi:NADPH:quinone reductase-like Zn-dependent oxidoreductase/mannose-6-phosphate isomerase-like protein (cupin superfamily)
MDKNEASTIRAQTNNYAEAILDPGSGERIAFLRTDPELVVFDDYVPASMAGPPVHWHPRQSETFEVLKGTLFIQANGKWFRLEPGHRVTIPPGVPHTFDNARSSSDVVFRATFSPGLDTDELFRSLVSLGESRTSLKALLRVARAQTRLRSRFFMTSPAFAWVERGFFALLAALHRLVEGGPPAPRRLPAQGMTVPSTPELAPTNRKWVVNQRGGPEHIQLVDDVPPAPGKGEVRVRVLAASVQHTDALIRRGMIPGATPPVPFVSGYDFVGRVDDIGPGADPALMGALVAATPVTGAHARYAVVSADQVTTIPDDTDPAIATALVMSGVTAFQLLHRAARVQAGETVLITAAGSYVGRLAAQIALRHGARVIGLAGPRHLEWLRSIGVEAYERGPGVLERLRTELEGGVDVVLDSVGENGFRTSFSMLRPKGRLIAFGFEELWSSNRSGLSIGINFARFGWWSMVSGRRAAFYSYGAQTAQARAQNSEDLKSILALVRKGQLVAPLEAPLTMEDKEFANAEIEKNAGRSGKLILNPWLEVSSDRMAAAIQHVS